VDPWNGQAQARQQGAPRQQQRPQVSVDPYVGIEDARGFERNPERPGTTIQVITGCRQQVAQTGLPFLVARKQVLAVLYSDPSSHPHYVGEVVEHCMFYSLQYPQYYQRDVKQVISVATGRHPDEITREVAIQMTSDAEPLIGFVVECEVSFRPRPDKNGQLRTSTRYKRRFACAELGNIVAPEVLAALKPELVQRMQTADATVAQAAPPLPGGPGPIEQQMMQGSGTCEVCGWVDAHAPGCDQIPF
jgi:hypothetical protein